MYPPISLEAEQLLRSLIVDHVLCAGLLGAPRAEAASEELVAKGLIVVHPLDGLGRPTSLGARKLLDLLLREENAAPCRCGHTREEHTAESPHGCTGRAPPCSCRSFTAATPVLRTDRPPSTAPPPSAPPTDPAPPLSPWSFGAARDRMAQERRTSVVCLCGHAVSRHALVPSDGREIVRCQHVEAGQPCACADLLSLEAFAAGARHG